jgi:hypothetical protein
VATIDSELFNAVFVLVSDDSYSDEQAVVTRIILAYDIKNNSLLLRPGNITTTQLGLNSSEKLEIKLTDFGARIIATDGVKMIAIDGHNLSNYW